MLRVAGVDPDNVRPLAHVSEISPRPLLLVAGTADNDTPLPVMERLFAAAGEPKQLWVVPGAGHGGAFALAPQEYAERVIGFLDRALLPAVKAGAAR